MPQFYIAEQSQVRSKLHSLSEVSVSIDKWTHEYKDVITAEQWELSTPNPEAGEQALLLLKRMPLLDLDNVIQLALYSTDNNNIAGAIYDLMQRERKGQQDVRSKLLTALEEFIQQPLRNADKERVKLIVQQCELTNARNRREVVGRRIEEIEKDAEYFYVQAARARKILEKIQA